MTSIAHRPAPCDALRGLVDDISQQRFSMSIETLRILQESLHLAHALVTYFPWSPAAFQPMGSWRRLLHDTRMTSSR
ncbi:hypothetical protein VTO73DRAFT_5360 [Trametes versicolor]